MYNDALILLIQPDGGMLTAKYAVSLSIIQYITNSDLIDYYLPSRASLNPSHNNLYINDIIAISQVNLLTIWTYRDPPRSLLLRATATAPNAISPKTWEKPVVSGLLYFPFPSGPELSPVAPPCRRLREGGVERKAQFKWYIQNEWMNEWKWWKI